MGSYGEFQGEEPEGRDWGMEQRGWILAARMQARSYPSVSSSPFPLVSEIQQLLSWHGL